MEFPMQVDARQVQELRAKTGAGIMDCKRALSEGNGDLEKAIEWLRKKGLSAAARKSARIASEGLVEAYIHPGGRIGVLLEVNAETDFVARNEEFKLFVHDIAMHVAAANPTYVTRADVPADVLAKEKEILAAQVVEEAKNKPANVIEKIVEGRLNKKFYQETCLLDQPFVKEPEKSVEIVLNELVAKIGEKIAIRRFARFQLGEGMEKRSQDFAAEVAKATQGN
jgi:elongation factor Ts